MNKPLTINIKKKVSSIDDVYGVYISILESVTNLKFPNQEKIVLVKILKDREVTKNVKDCLGLSKDQRQRVANILTKFRNKNIIKDNKISQSFLEFKDNIVTFNIALSNG